MIAFEEVDMRRRCLTACLVVACCAAVAGAEPPPGESALFGKLQREIEGRVAALDGFAGVYVEDLASARTIAIHADEIFPQASAIKVAVLYELFRRSEEKGIDLGERIRLPAKRVGGGGTLEHLSPEAELSLGDLAVFMIVESDNDAANALIDRLGLESVSARMSALGLGQTRLRRRMIDLEAARAGRENVSTPREMAALLKLVRSGAGLSTERSRAMRSILALGHPDPFRSALPDGVRVLEKPGELEGVRTSVALVDLARRPYVAVIDASYLAREADGDAAIRDLSALLYTTFERLDRASSVGRFLYDR